MLRGYVETLDVFDKVVLQYYYYEGMPVYYIAQVIGCDASVVKSRIYEIKARVKYMLPYEGGTGTQLYDMTALPILWLIFKSALTKVPVAVLCGGASASAVGAGIAIGEAATGGTGAAGGIGAVAGSEVAGVAAGSGVAGGTGAAVGSGVTAGSAVGAGIGVKIAVAVAATALVGGGVAAFAKLQSEETNEMETETATEQIITEVESESTTEATTEATTEVVEETATEEMPTEETTEVEIDLNEASRIAYQEFLNGDRTAMVMDNGEFTEDEYSILKPGEEVSISILDDRYLARYKDENTDCRCKRYYGYADFINDGIDELGILYRTEYYTDYESLAETEDGYYEWSKNIVYLKYIDGELYIFAETLVTDEMSGGEWINSDGEVYVGGSFEDEVDIFDSDCIRHEIYLNTCYEWLNVKDSGFENVIESMRNEFDVDIGETQVFRIGGKLCYTSWSNEGLLDDTQWQRYKELMAENNIVMYSQEEIDSLIESEEKKYVPDGFPDDVPEIDWVEF